MVDTQAYYQWHELPLACEASGGHLKFKVLGQLACVALGM